MAMIGARASRENPLDHGMGVGNRSSVCGSPLKSVTRTNRVTDLTEMTLTPSTSKRSFSRLINDI